jgi:hypothetical protein
VEIGYLLLRNLNELSIPRHQRGNAQQIVVEIALIVVKSPVGNLEHDPLILGMP